MREVLQSIPGDGRPAGDRACGSGRASETDPGRHRWRTLSFMGLPTPNLFAGEHNFHSRLEWVSAQDMDRAVAVIVELCRVWEKSRN